MDTARDQSGPGRRVGRPSGNPKPWSCLSHAVLGCELIECDIGRLVWRHSAIILVPPLSGRQIQDAQAVDCMALRIHHAKPAVKSHMAARQFPDRSCTALRPGSWRNGMPPSSWSGAAWPPTPSPGSSRTCVGDPRPHCGVCALRVPTHERAVHHGKHLLRGGRLRELAVEAVRRALCIGGVVSSLAAPYLDGFARSRVPHVAERR